MYNFLKRNILDKSEDKAREMFGAIIQNEYDKLRSLSVERGNAIGDSVRAAETGAFLGYTIVVTPVKVAYGAIKYLANSWETANSIPYILPDPQKVVALLESYDPENELFDRADFFKKLHSMGKLSVISLANGWAYFAGKSITFLSVNSAIKSHDASIISDKTGIAEGTISKFAPVAAHIASEVSRAFYLDMALVAYSGYVNVKEDSESSYGDYLCSALIASVMTYGVSKITYAYPIYRLSHIFISSYYVVNKNDPDYDINYYDVASKVLSDAANPETFAMNAYKLAMYANPQISWAMSLGVAVSSYFAAEYYESLKDQDTYTPCLPSLELLGLCGDGNQDDDLADL